MHARAPQAYTPADPVEVLWARAEPRAYLIREGEIDRPLDYFVEFIADAANKVRGGILDIHSAVDAVQEIAVHSGLLVDLGQDRIQALMAAKFATAPTKLRAAG